MRRFLKATCFLFVLVSICSCRKKEWDEFYGRPENLGDPIYQQLEAKGNFKHLINIIDKAGYKDILSKSGYWTFFAPDDEAFELYFKEQNRNIDDISPDEASSIIKYSLVFNGYTKDELGNYQTGSTSQTGLGMGFKRKTSYYDWVQKDPSVNKTLISTNRNNTVRRSGSSSTVVVNVFNYLEGDNNNKYIPYVTEKFFAAQGLTGTDYEAFFPGVSYSGFNVAGASVKEGDIFAENGVIHITNRVILPLKSLDQYIASESQYSEFKKLLDSLSYYNFNFSLTQRNTVLSGSSDSVFVKSYDGQLAFSPNNESYQTPGTSIFSNTASQANSYTLIAPTNTAFLAYRNKILSKYGSSFFKGAPSTVLIDFLNSHMAPSVIWPSKFKSIANYYDETPTMEWSDVVDKKMLSNGIFYGVNKPMEANVFRTLYGVPYLDPAYRMTLSAYSDLSTNIKAAIVQPNVKHTILLMPDALLSQAGWRYNESSAGSGTTAWGFKSATSSTYSHNQVYREQILRIFKTGVIPSFEGDIDFSGTGIVEALNGEYIKYNNNKIQTSGTIDEGKDINIVASDRSSTNGVAYQLDGILTYSEKNVGQHIENLSKAYPENYESFFWFLSNSNIYNKTTKAISGVNIGADNSYTVFAPSNEAIKQAIMAGLLPGNKTTGARPTSAPTKEDELDKVRKFILYHIVNGATIAADGKKSDNYVTLLQTETGDNILVSVANLPANTEVTDVRGRSANVIIDKSNQLSNRTLIHSIDNYLDYNR